MELIHGSFVSGSGPNAEIERNAGLCIMYGVIRRGIEALPENCSKGDVLRVLDECESWRLGGGRFPPPFFKP
jgi:hypothetical protein